MSRALRAAAAGVVAAVLVATLAGPAPAAPPSSDAAGPAAAPARAVRPRVTKLLVFVVENHSIQQMRRDMPWLNRIAGRYGYASRYHGLTHPSLPNYLAIAGGDMFGVTDDGPPSEHPIRGASVFGRAIRAGRSATTYAEGMTSRCQQVDGGRYLVRHNPWTYFTSERRLCRRHDVPVRRLGGDVTAGDLPRVGLVVPDACNDGHDCSLGRADTWLRRHAGPVLRGPDFASGHLAVVVTADEDDGDHGNRVLTVVAHPRVHHQVVRRRLTHYSLSRAYAEAAGITPLRHAATSRSLLRAFGLR